ncbi:MAG: serine kinase, partial [Actinobacteria bacterium]|nr:serine kinase [Actinomycetota bacterium]NIU68452.1 serine kinase [Actinomycetota bacterium]NIW30279.1 serine kinase [Actinomycetota bacterium]NIX22697.1 serine kinase [Actinomycetota bacterium]
MPDVLEGLRQHYGLDGSLRPLPGDRDRNFLLATEEGARYVVKVSSPDESDEILEIEADLMEHLDDYT